MTQSFANTSVLLFAGPDFEDRELLYPYFRFLEAGAPVTVAGLGEPVYTGKCGVPINTNGRYEDFVKQPWDVLIIPGGWAPDKIRMNEAALQIVQNTLKAGKIVAAICHGPWVLTSANVVKGRQATSYRAVKDDLVHAGAHWVDEAVVVDRNGPGVLVTSRTPDDLPAFMRAVLSTLSSL